LIVATVSPGSAMSTAGVCRADVSLDRCEHRSLLDFPLRAEPCQATLRDSRRG
jgi:hypothetical protein